ncbi:hypothetical protein KSP39_PZI022095 [Platanthera zijinensis]|uniref:RING-type domain-containing protein n=1 Tax=Platanthera zijinensis TaxID=2320716 RepID=A0AAP0AYH3_9ASPA
MAVPAFSPLLLLEGDEKKGLSWPSDPESDLTAMASSSNTSSSAWLNCEMEGLVHRYAEQINEGISEIHGRNWEAMTLAFVARLREKEAQTERLWIENAALLEKLRALTLQNHQLFAVARRCEALSATLRTSFEAVIRQNDAAAREREGFGDSCEVGDTESSCGRKAMITVADGWRYRCRVCGEREVSVMVIPCHHLCLCVVCEAVACECPCCCEPKRGAIQVLL